MTHAAPPEQARTVSSTIKPPEAPGSGPVVKATATLDAEVAAEPTVRVFSDGRLFVLVAAVPILTTAVLVALRFVPGDPMLATGLGAVVIGFVVFLVFASRIPEAFALVRLRGLVPANHIARYLDFERGISRALNSRMSLVFGGAGAVAGFARYPVAAGGIDPLVGQGPRAVGVWGPVAIADMVGETLIGAAAGLAIWRMLVVGLKVYELGRLPLQIQLGHPDRCGGFKPLGDLCLWNALILSVPGVFLGWWILVGPASQYGSRYVALHSLLASVVVVLATVAFLLPLWRIHRVMVESARGLRDDIEQHGQRIDELTRKLIAAREDLPDESWERLAKDLERRQALYRANEKVPTWPIDVRLAVKFGTSQAVPLLGITGLGKPAIDAIKALTSFIDPG